MAEDGSPVALDEVERYEFTVSFPGTAYPGWRVDEPAPVGHDAGPNPVRTLALAVGHCMSSTLFNTLERAHVAVAPIRTTVRATVGRNAKGRQRVQELTVEIRTRPLREEDRASFEHCVEIFDDYCTVSGAVREGIRIDRTVTPG